MKKSERFHFFLGTALLVALVAAIPVLLEPGLLNTRGGGDSPFLLQRLHQLETAVYDGHFPVRWMPDANYGYGYPFYNYYAPLSIYIAFLFRLTGFSFVRAIHMAQLAGFLVAAWGMFVLARRWFQSEWAGLVTAVSYTIAPFHLVNVYVRGDSLAEFWAMAFYPLVILAADNTLQLDQTVQQKRKNVLFLAVTYACLILSHNISALIFSPFLIFYILMLWLMQNRFNLQSAIFNLQSLLPPFSAGVLALALAAWFFVPALAETGLAQLGTVTEGYFFYGTHFLGTDKLPLVQRTFFFDFGVNGRSAFRMGLIQAILALISIIVIGWLWLKKQPDSSSPPHPRTPSPHPPFILLTILLSTLMLLPQSNWFWENVPLLSFTQFPWRFLSVQAFGIALAAGGLAKVRAHQWFIPALIFILVYSSLGLVQTDHLILTDADVTAEKLAQYEWFTGNIGTTVSAEYLPHTVEPRPYTSAWLNSGERDKVVAMSGEIEAFELLQREAINQVWRVETAVSSTLRFDTLYWPGWTAKVDGKAVPIWASAGSGLIELEVAPGSHEIELRLVRTMVRLWAEWVSFFGVLVAIWLLWPERRPKIDLTYAFVVLIGLLVLRLWLSPQEPVENNTLNWDFAQMGYLHHAPSGVLFENGAFFNRYQIDQTVVTAGETITIRLGLGGNASDVTVSLTSPAANRPEFDPTAPILVSQTGNQSNFELTIPESAPAGLYVPRVTVENGRSLTPSGRKRGDLFLEPIRVVNDVASIEMEQLFDVQVASMNVRDGDVLDVQLAWMTKRPLSHNYNVALRLTDANGNFLRLADHQPGYGYQPSSIWQPGVWQYDWQAIPLPSEDENHLQPFILIAQLYETTDSGNVVLTRRLGELERERAVVNFVATEPVFDVPEGVLGETAVFNDHIRLVGYTYTETDNELQLDLVWQTIENRQQDYIRFVHLIDPERNAAPVAQVDSMPQNNSYPTSQWVDGEVVVDRVRLNLNNVPPGSYQVAVGFYQIVDDVGIRETAVDENGVPLQDNRFLLPNGVLIP